MVHSMLVFRGVPSSELTEKRDLWKRSSNIDSISLQNSSFPGNSAGDLFGMVVFCDLSERLSPPTFGDEKVTLNHLVHKHSDI